MIASVSFSLFDWTVLFGYFVGILSLGLIFWRRNNSAEQFTAGGRSLPGWLCGLSIFATYLSSISYLALPGKAFVDNWNAAMFSFALPFAAWVAVRYFVPLYRESGAVSAYALLEDRFGLWARLFASGFYLLYQIARIGVVMYLMALPMAVLFGWDIRALIVITGVIVTAYSFVGGIVAVIWADAIQAIVLLAGALLALGILLWGLPGGPMEVITLANESGKFSLGETSLSILDQPTVWVVLGFGFFDNLRNFSVDQSYVQRYIAASSDKQARRSVWLGALLYVPVSLLFLFIGTSLFAFYQSHPTDAAGLRSVVARQRVMQDGIDPGAADFEAAVAETASELTQQDFGDRAFPHFIATHLPVGVRGLLIAAIFAAAMSTVSTSLNSSATLVMSDFYARLVRPTASDAEQLWVLRAGTVVWGGLGTAMALTFVQLTESILDIWWLLSGALGAGIVGLFLMGWLVRGVRGVQAVAALTIAMGLILWMTVSPSGYWPEGWAEAKSPLHQYLVVVVGPSVMVGLGLLFARLGSQERGTAA